MRQMTMVAFLQAQNCTNLAMSWRHPLSRTDSWSPDYYRTVRDFIHFSGRGRVHNPVIGGPKEVADRLEQWFVERGCDGFVIPATHVPGAYEDFVRFVVPELQRRGLFRKDHAGTTLRENLGMPVAALGDWRRPRIDRRMS